MLNVEINAKGYELSDELRQRADDKFGALDKYDDKLEQVRVTFAWHGGKGEQTSVRAEASGGGDHFDASVTDWKAESALDKTEHDLETQIRRAHEKQISERDRKHR